MSKVLSDYRHIDYDAYLNPPEESDPQIIICPVCYGDGEDWCLKCDGYGCDNCNDGMVSCVHCWGQCVVVEEHYVVSGMAEER